MEDKLTKCSTGFRKSHGTQHSLLPMPERRKRGIGLRRIHLSFSYGPLKTP